MSSLEQKKRPSLQITADAGSVAGAESSVPGLSPATTPQGASAGFLPDMPQWKKDLIQRRKTNVARTNAAAGSPTTSSSSSALTADSSFAALTEPADSGETDANAATATIASQQQRKHGKRNINQTQQQPPLPPLKAAPKTSTTEEKSEKCFIRAGGHHTLPATATTTTTTNTETALAQSTQGKDLNAAFSTETAASAAAATVAGNAPIPKQRSSLFNTRSQSTSKEQEILNLDTRERERERERERDANVNIDAEVTNAAMLNSCQTNNRSRSRGCGEVETGTTTTTATTTGALTAIVGHSHSDDGERDRDVGAAAVETATTATATTSSSSANQLQTKCKLGQSGAETAAISPLNFNNSGFNNKAKISDKLQSNKFIKNQQEQQQQQQQLERQTTASPTKVAVKATMVAMQEMKKTTTQNGQHRHHHHRQHQQQLALKNGGESDVEANVAAMQTQLVDADHSEDLSYGPGIVSKLRCRYLSLALRCESQQQSQKQRLQRSTSLNTLLDRNDDDDDEDEEEQQQQQQQQQQLITTQSSVVNTRNQVVPPPILSAKPQLIAGYNKNASIVQQQQRQQQQQSQQQQQQSKPEQGSNGTARSRHFKRGNEVMKRARSVEALLCEKSPWNTQRASYQAATVSSSSNMVTSPTAASAAACNIGSPTCVTIEDKIHNARERLHGGIDTAPPKRLTSIIDDTERPPPDLVKQTLKMFEASANRRPRAAQRNNGVGGVASKVASYKSIIKEQQPTSTGGISSSSSSSVSKVAGFAASTPKQRPGSASAVVPDIIPRQLDSSSAFDSPVSLGRMHGIPPILPIPIPSPMPTAYRAESRPADSQRLVSGSNPEQRSKAHEAINDQQQKNDVDDDDGGDKDDGGVDAHADAGKNNKNNDNGNASGAGDSNIDDENVDDSDVDDDNNDSDGDSDSNSNSDVVCIGDNMGAAGDKQTSSFSSEASATTAAAAAGGAAALAQRSFSNNSNSNYKKLSQRIDSNESGTQTAKQIGVIRPLLSSSSSNNASSSNQTSSGSCQPLTIREIEKNRINEMKKSTALAADAAAAAAAGLTSLDTVINTKGASETDAAASGSGSDLASGSGISPIWPLRKRRQHPGSSGMVTAGGHLVGSSGDHNTSMVFNFSKSTKEVPDYIESDVVIYRRKRELPKPNEPGFVLLGDLTVETSTDMDYDDYSMCPPSPCDVEFENANIVIDGKSSIRQKSKDSSFRVQFNDTLTSTFEYPSEASQIVDDPPYADPYGNVNKHHQLLYEEQLMQQQKQHLQQQQQHHHVTSDEIIELPTATASSSSGTTAASTSTSTNKASATSAMLGNLPLDII
ncbi:serine-rich adhesin for platelets isoform X2 [Drosophila busckii]|uniref:serine-rich adhesin for platelets isoform X2 n=1 Tax=Drosophila busckii TaxID=30019 RepID=UPI00083EDBDA|nr:serine-rich adhesin for platelets isoform X2 [Drosophila busckii]